jgi:sugar phosphate isomerase/epimerase
MRPFGVSTHLYHAKRLQRDHLLEIAANGFEAVEIFATRSHFDYHDAAAIEALATWIRDAGLNLHSIHAPVVEGLSDDDTWGQPFFNATRDESARRLAIRETEAALAIARRIPTRFLVVHLGTPSSLNPGPDDNSRSAALRSVEEIQRLASPLGVRVALEVIPNDLSTPAALVSLIEDELDAADVGICLDVGHGSLLGDPVDAVETASGHVITTHVHDNLGRTDDHLVPFAGAIDWPSVLMAMEKIGYDGLFMLEVRNTSTTSAVLGRARDARSRFERILDTNL